MTEPLLPEASEIHREGTERSIQVLVADDAERDVLRELLEDRYTVVTEGSVTDADLYLVDERAFPEHVIDLEYRLEDEFPTFCPVVVIRRPNSLGEMPETKESEFPRIIDDVLDAPLTREETFRRLDLLLIRREKSQHLHRSIRDLDEANKQLERMTSVLSHDLRNPVQVAQTRLSLLKDEFPDAGGHIEPIERAFLRIEDLVENLLAIREVNAGIDREVVSLQSIVDEAWGYVPTQDATLQTAEGFEGHVHADRQYLLQIFENLFRNAVVHVGSDVTITVGQFENGFYVEDDGPGIPPAERTEVLRMGYSTREDGSGNGLGLNIVARTTDAHGWDFEIAEGNAGGARFEIAAVEFVTDPAGDEW